MSCDVAVLCTNLDASAQFYTALGAVLGVEDGGGERPDYFFGKLSSLMLTLAPADSPAAATRHLNWGVEVPCLLEVWTALDAAGLSDRYQLYPHGYLIAEDPDWNRVTVRERRSS